MNSLYFYQFYFETKNTDTLNTKKKMYNINNFFNGNVDFFQLSYTIYETIQFYFAKEKKEKNNQTEITLVYAMHSKL